MKSSSQTLQISVSIIMSILRGSIMRFMVQELRRAEMRADIIMRRAQHWLGGVSVGVVKEVFHAWLQFLEQRLAEKAEEARKAALEAARAPAQVHIEGHENGPTQSAKLMRWRKHEELRRNAKHRVKIFGISVSICFTYWKRHARERGAAVGRPRPLPRQSKTVGSNLVSAGTGERILAEFTLLETLYESRIGSAERLLAFFVMFHQAVKPLSRLPWWGYDLDRSASRLRVASTPAPVGFVETLRKEVAEQHISEGANDVWDNIKNIHGGMAWVSDEIVWTLEATEVV